MGEVASQRGPESHLAVLVGSIELSSPQHRHRPRLVDEPPEQIARRSPRGAIVDADEPDQSGAVQARQQRDARNVPRREILHGVAHPWILQRLECDGVDTLPGAGPKLPCEHARLHLRGVHALDGGGALGPDLLQASTQVLGREPGITRQEHLEPPRPRAGFNPGSRLDRSLRLLDPLAGGRAHVRTIVDHPVHGGRPDPASLAISATRRGVEPEPCSP